MNKRDNIVKWSIVSIFVGLYAMVSLISTIHVIDFFRLSNPNWLAITLAIAFEIGAAASLGAIVILDKTSRFLVWMLFLLITGMQMMGNMYYAYTHLTEYTSWSELFGLIEEEPIYQKRILSLISGAILPIVALGFIKSLVDYIRPSKPEELTEKEKQKQAIIDLMKADEDSGMYENTKDTKIDTEKIWDKVKDLREEGKLPPEPTEEELKEEPTALANSQYRNEEPNPHDIVIESVDNREEWPPKEEVQFYENEGSTEEKSTPEVKPTTVNTVQELRRANKMHA